MGKHYTVVQGDYLSKIAKDHGFSDYLVLWNHPENAKLKKERENPNVLYPGDKVFIPDREEKVASISTDAKHRFEVIRKPLMLRLIIEDMYETPRSETECELLVGNKRIPDLITDGQGKIQTEISAGETEAFLTLKKSKKKPEAQAIEISVPIRIGNLNPITKISGQKARLNNLGYFGGTPEESDDEDPKATEDMTFRSAVEEFQCDHSLVVDGKCGPNTQAKLKQVHGC